MSTTFSDRLAGVTASLAVKVPVKVATTANITLSGTQTIDGVSLSADDRVLVKDQDTASENGIYIVSSTAWSRSPDFDGARDVVEGTRIPVNQGDTYAGTDFVVTNTGTITIGTTGLTFKNQAIFSDTYLGPHASDPTTKNDGSALEEGDLYYDTANDVMKAYNGSSWSATVISSSAFMATLLDDTTAAAARTTLVAAKSGANTDITSLAGLTEGSAPSTGAGEGALYLKDTSGQPELFFREESNGDEVQITSGGSLNGASVTTGVYTPTITCGTSGTITLNTSVNTLSYAQIGSLVYVFGRLTVTSVSSPTGRIHMTLPVAAAAGTEGSNTSAVTCFMSGMVSANARDVVAILSGSSNRIEIYLGDGTSVQSDSAQQVQASTDIYINATYMAS